VKEDRDTRTRCPNQGFHFSRPTLTPDPGNCPIVKRQNQPKVGGGGTEKRGRRGGKRIIGRPIPHHSEGLGKGPNESSP